MTWHRLYLNYISINIYLSDNIVYNFDYNYYLSCTFIINLINLLLISYTYYTNPTCFNNIE